MLFTSSTFAFVYLPIVVMLFFTTARFSHTAAAMSLFAASLIFYGYWMPQFTLLLISSICVNFFVGKEISRGVSSTNSGRVIAKRWLILGVALNLALLGYFKYANFFVDTLQSALGVSWHFGRIILPIGISFFTFTQIAFLADAFQKGIREYKFAHYGLFVTYFPHLVAGPVLHHAQMMPQFAKTETYRFNSANFAAGMGIFVLGLTKKVILADGISPYADAVFDAADHGAHPTSNEAWLAALAYTFQLYFDFSGYSDMAIGLSWLLNIKLPFNFDSPYRSFNISEFWRRWHMSLSTFLRDYLYIPLGGNKLGATRRYTNLFVTMLLGGLWHGANWTFVFWGGLHGIYLAVNHAFQALCRRYAPSIGHAHGVRYVGWLITMLAVIVAWVFFRAQTFSGARRILGSMFGNVETSAFASLNPLLWNAGLNASTGLWLCVALGAIAFLAPNSNRIGNTLLTACATRISLRFWIIGFATSLAFFLVILNATRSAASPFIYFNF